MNELPRNRRRNIDATRSKSPRLDASILGERPQAIYAVFRIPLCEISGKKRFGTSVLRMSESEFQPLDSARTHRSCRSPLARNKKFKDFARPGPQALFRTPAKYRIMRNPSRD